MSYFKNYQLGCLSKDGMSYEEAILKVKKIVSEEPEKELSILHGWTEGTEEGFAILDEHLGTNIGCGEEAVYAIEHFYDWWDSDFDSEYIEE